MLLNLQVPTGATINYLIETQEAGSTSVLRAQPVISGTTSVIIELTSNTQFIRIRGVVVNGATAGTFRLRWAQSNAGTQPVVVKAGSFFRFGTF